MDIVKALRNGDTSIKMDDGRIELVNHVAADEIERLVKEHLSTHKNFLLAEEIMNDLLRWCEALAIVGSVTPEAWTELAKIITKSSAALMEEA